MRSIVLAAALLTTLLPPMLPPPDAAAFMSWVDLAPRGGQDRTDAPDLPTRRIDQRHLAGRSKRQHHPCQHHWHPPSFLSYISSFFSSPPTISYLFFPLLLCSLRIFLFFPIRMG